MTVVKDWMSEAAQAIIDTPGTLLRDDVRQIIATHSPFKDFVAYMPVPRCETCRHWGQSAWMTWSQGVCAKLNIGRHELLSTTADFGCVRWEAK